MTPSWLENIIYDPQLYGNIFNFYYDNKTYSASPIGEFIFIVFMHYLFLWPSVQYHSCRHVICIDQKKLFTFRQLLFWPKYVDLFPILKDQMREINVQPILLIYVLQCKYLW